MASTHPVPSTASDRLGDLVTPVLDLREGRVVHAHGGDRASYPILKLEGARAGEPLDIISYLLGLYPFHEIYVADLDALTGRPAQVACLKRIQTHFPSMVFWLDTGGAGIGLPPGMTPVIGTESIPEISENCMPGGRPWCLSVDHRDGRLLGALPAGDLRKTPPRMVIDMNLDSVGQRRGIKTRLATVHPFVARNTGAVRALAGGLRTAGDIRAANKAGFSRVLIGTALYTGALGEGDLRSRLPTSHEEIVARP